MYIHVHVHVHVLMRDEEGRKKEASKVKQINKAKQHSTPKSVTFPKKNELPRVGLEPTPLYTLDRALYQLSYRVHVHVPECMSPLFSAATPIQYRVAACVGQGGFSALHTADISCMANVTQSEPQP